MKAPFSEHNIMHSFVIMPHTRRTGGAKFYIYDLIDLLKQVGNVKVAGPHACDYDEAIIQSACLDTLTLQCLPTYEGICLIRRVYHMSLSALRAVPLIIAPRKQYFKEPFSVLVLTSSVQAMAVPLARWLFPDKRIAIVVQENVRLSRGLGWLTSLCLRRAHVVISISASWARHAQANGLAPITLPNRYDAAYAAPEHNQEQAITSDLLYVGGGAAIKGFNNMIMALPALLKTPGRRIICLGEYSDGAKRTLERIRNDARPHATLTVVGLVPDIRPYLRGTKLLVLPLGNPHFCRPAIEAGLFGKTFVIPHFPALEDFVLNGENCATYDASTPDELIYRVDELLRKDDVRHRLERGNKRLAARFCSNTTHFLHALLPVLSHNENRTISTL